MADITLLTADPKAGFLAHAEEIRAAIERVLASGYYILGPEVEAFEREWAAYLGGGYAVGVANGTEAIELTLRAVGVGRGDAVATVANTVSATAAAIEQIGARLVFVEIDPATMTMSAEALGDGLRKEGGFKKGRRGGEGGGAGASLRASGGHAANREGGGAIWDEGGGGLRASARGGGGRQEGGDVGRGGGV
jgi:Predicted pyridoxal phosphate-dependent enzyme apparently involved in regulation of cell wall biogenesis